MKSPIISASQLSHAYGAEGSRTEVLKGVDLEIVPGEMVAIQGPSGSGKSTLLYLLAGLLKPQAGSVRIFGRDVASLSGDELAALRNTRIGFVFQQFHLLPKESVLENILLPTRFPCRQSGSEATLRARAVELARALGLGDRLGHLPSQLSGGQQQRVAIARALINGSELILADEPTGNLDSASAAQILDELGRLRDLGKTVVIITHDEKVAARCSKVFCIRDGRIQKVERSATSCQVAEPQPPVSPAAPTASATERFRTIRSSVSLAISDLRKHKVRSALTMLGITVGVASLLAVMTLGGFIEGRLVDSYSKLGVRTISMFGLRNPALRATDVVQNVFDSFHPERDIQALKTVFPQIRNVSAAIVRAEPIHFGGLRIDRGASVFGVEEEYFKIFSSPLLLGHGLKRQQVESRSSVCLIGFEIARRLFVSISPLGQYLRIGGGLEQAIGCRVIGVLDRVSTLDAEMDPNFRVFVPYTLLQAAGKTRIERMMIGLHEGEDATVIGRGLTRYFEAKYGKSGKFRVGTYSLLIAQMKKSLGMLALLLSVIALISLFVGGIGITNMMLVSVSERFREIGIQKAMGASDDRIRLLFLVESLAISAFGGAFGILLGVGLYQVSILVASKVVADLAFAWIIDPSALLLSLLSILVVGLASGLVPALRAQRLQVIEALRAD
ncbi:MAG TPA: ATP-binding cassette domain-containing protein [Bdellovibrionota bacterium]|nr:ATP-binding cassette domain-containing protein [Bdellovibrionota bacterium]